MRMKCHGAMRSTPPGHPHVPAGSNGWECTICGAVLHGISSVPPRYAHREGERGMLYEDDGYTDEEREQHRRQREIWGSRL